MLQLSRDDPNVMKSVQRQLEEKVKEEGNPVIYSAPCSIHPAHTAFKKNMEALTDKAGIDIASLLRKLYTWFKLSTARREDMKDIFSDCNEKEAFFLRHVSTRWLSMKPCLIRFLDHIDSVLSYFLDYLPSSKDQSCIQARKTEDFKAIHDMLKPTKVNKTLSCAYYSLFICTLNDGFLLNLQHEKPRIHMLYR